MPRKLFIITIFFILTVQYGQQSDYPFKNTELSYDERINDLLDRLNLEEKISLLIATSEKIPRLDINEYFHDNN